MKIHELPFLYIEAASFFRYPLIWHWWLTKEVQGVIRDSVSHQNWFSREIIVKRLFRRKKLLFLQKEGKKFCCNRDVTECKSKDL